MNATATYTRTYSATACFPERGLGSKSPFRKAASDSHIPAVHPQLNGDGEAPLLRWSCAATSPRKRKAFILSVLLFSIIRESAAFLFSRRRAIFSEMGTKKEANAER